MIRMSQTSSTVEVRTAGAASRWLLYEVLLLAVCAGLIGWQLFVPPSLGVADNNDFPKLAGRFCLGPESAQDYRLFEWASFRYRTGKAYCWESGLVTSAVLPLDVALLAARTGGRFDLRWLGAVYALLFLAALYGVLRLARELQPPARIAATAGVVLVFGGASYVPWFSTFYLDTASYAFLLLSLVALCRLVMAEAVRRWEFLVAVALLVLLAMSKAQHAPLALAALPCLWCSFGRTSFPARPVRALGIGVVIAAVCALFVTAPRWYQTVALYNALFYQALPHSENPARDLEQFELDRSWVAHVGEHAFMPDCPLIDPRKASEIGRRLTSARMVSYYLSHPRVTWIVFRGAIREGSFQRVRMIVGTREYRLGNYERSTGRPPEAQSNFFDGWSMTKVRLFSGRPVWYLFYAAGLFGGLWLLVLRSPAGQRPRFVLLAATLTGMAALAAAAVMFDGVDTGRHLFVFNALLDVAVCALFAGLGRCPAERPAPL